MTENLMILGIYAAATITALAISFLARKLWLRIVAMILSGLLLFPVVLIAAIGAIFWEAGPPSLAELQRKFPTRQPDLNSLVQMSNEDIALGRIAPDWLDQRIDGRWEQHRRGDPEAAITNSRWDAYRAIFDRTGIKQGFLRDDYGDVFIMADSIGLLNRGHTTGYLYCAASQSRDANRFPPCTLDKDSGKQKYNDSPRREAYKFERVGDHWFAYDEGPS